MGFMKFMKKDKATQSADSLDIPPPPPPPQAGEATTTAMPDAQLPNSQSGANFVLPSEQKADESFDIPPVTQDTNLPNSSPASEPQSFAVPDAGNSSFDDLISPQQAPPQPKPVSSKPRTVHTDKAVFVEVSKYKQVLRELNSVKNTLKRADNEITNLTSSSTEEEKSFSEINSTLASVESKLVRLEDSLFEQ